MSSSKYGSVNSGTTGINYVPSKKSSTQDFLNGGFLISGQSHQGMYKNLNLGTQPGSQAGTAQSRAIGGPEFPVRLPGSTSTQSPPHLDKGISRGQFLGLTNSAVNPSPGRALYVPSAMSTASGPPFTSGAGALGYVGPGGATGSKKLLVAVEEAKKHLQKVLHQSQGPRRPYSAPIASSAASDSSLQSTTPSSIDAMAIATARVRSKTAAITAATSAASVSPHIFRHISDAAAGPSGSSLAGYQLQGHNLALTDTEADVTAGPLTQYGSDTGVHHAALIPKTHPLSARGPRSTWRPGSEPSGAGAASGQPHSHLGSHHQMQLIQNQLQQQQQLRQQQLLQQASKNMVASGKGLMPSANSSAANVASIYLGQITGSAAGSSSRISAASAAAAAAAAKNKYKASAAKSGGATGHASSPLSFSTKRTIAGEASSASSGAHGGTTTTGGASSARGALGRLFERTAEVTGKPSGSSGRARSAGAVKSKGRTAMEAVGCGGKTATESTGIRLAYGLFRKNSGSDVDKDEAAENEPNSDAIPSTEDVYMLVSAPAPEQSAGSKGRRLHSPANISGGSRSWRRSGSGGDASEEQQAAVEAAGHRVSLLSSTLSGHDGAAPFGASSAAGSLLETESMAGETSMVSRPISARSASAEPFRSQASSQRIGSASVSNAVKSCNLVVLGSGDDSSSGSSQAGTGFMRPGSVQSHSSFSHQPRGVAAAPQEPAPDSKSEPNIGSGSLLSGPYRHRSAREGLSSILGSRIGGSAEGRPGASGVIHVDDVSIPPDRSSSSSRGLAPATQLLTASLSYPIPVQHADISQLKPSRSAGSVSSLLPTGGRSSGCASPSPSPSLSLSSQVEAAVGSSAAVRMPSSSSSGLSHRPLSDRGGPSTSASASAASSQHFHPRTPSASGEVSALTSAISGLQTVLRGQGRLGKSKGGAGTDAALTAVDPGRRREFLSDLSTQSGGPTKTTDEDSGKNDVAPLDSCSLTSQPQAVEKHRVPAPASSAAPALVPTASASHDYQLRFHLDPIQSNVSGGLDAGGPQVAAVLSPRKTSAAGPISGGGEPPVDGASSLVAASESPPLSDSRGSESDGNLHSAISQSLSQSQLKTQSATLLPSLPSSSLVLLPSSILLARDGTSGSRQTSRHSGGGSGLLSPQHSLGHAASPRTESRYAGAFSFADADVEAAVEAEAEADDPQWKSDPSVRASDRSRTPRALANSVGAALPADEKKHNLDNKGNDKDKDSIPMRDDSSRGVSMSHPFEEEASSLSAQTLPSLAQTALGTSASVPLSLYQLQTQSQSQAQAQEGQMLKGISSVTRAATGAVGFTPHPPYLTRSSSGGRLAAARAAAAAVTVADATPKQGSSERLETAAGALGSSGTTSAPTSALLATASGAAARKQVSAMIGVSKTSGAESTDAPQKTGLEPLPARKESEASVIVEAREASSEMPPVPGALVGEETSSEEAGDGATGKAASHTTEPVFAADSSPPRGNGSGVSSASPPALLRSAGADSGGSPKAKSCPETPPNPASREIERSPVSLRSDSLKDFFYDEEADEDSEFLTPLKDDNTPPAKKNMDPDSIMLSQSGGGALYPSLNVPQRLRLDLSFVDQTERDSGSSTHIAPVSVASQNPNPLLAAPSASSTSSTGARRPGSPSAVSAPSPSAVSSPQRLQSRQKSGTGVNGGSFKSSMALSPGKTTPRSTPPSDASPVRSKLNGKPEQSRAKAAEPGTAASSSISPCYHTGLIITDDATASLSTAAPQTAGSQGGASSPTLPSPLSRFDATAASLKSGAGASFGPLSPSGGESSSCPSVMSEKDRAASISPTAAIGNLHSPPLSPALRGSGGRLSSSTSLHGHGSSAGGPVGGGAGFYRMSNFLPAAPLPAPFVASAAVQATSALVSNLMSESFSLQELLVGSGGLDVHAILNGISSMPSPASSGTLILP